MSGTRVAVYVDSRLALRDFFESDRFLIFAKGAGGWAVSGEAPFGRVAPSNPADTRRAVEGLLPLVEGCDVLAGGGLYGIPFAVFDRAGKHIFEIGEISDGILDGILADIEKSGAEAAAKELAAREARPVETEAPGVYVLDLIALQSERPDVSSKKAMADFLENTPFFELRLICRHVPPWIENSGRYDVRATGGAGAVTAVITKKGCRPAGGA
ncbi:MAG: hypothetical protein LBG71_07385 [Clostridiales Family XIII bacterium]|jgi:hypothetical protein|nr:hypothetical protein [Clostridiales Family XIII bacterium]